MLGIYVYVLCDLCYLAYQSNLHASAIDKKCTKDITDMVRRGSVGSASACCKAGSSSILGSAPQGGFYPLGLHSDEEMEKGPGEW